MIKGFDGAYHFKTVPVVSGYYCLVERMDKQKQLQNEA